MTKSFKKTISITLALAMVVVTPVTAFAKDWYLENGDILIEANKDGQWVTQGSVKEEDVAPVITHDPNGPGYSDENNITVKTEGDAVAEFTIKDIDMGMGYNDGKAEAPSIDIGDSKAEMTVTGDNIIYHYGDYVDPDTDEEPYGENAAIHVGSGELTIKGDGILDIWMDSEGAKIGSNEEEDMSGTIHITDEVDIYTGDDGSGDGAAIGSGQAGDFTGKIIIDGNAYVEGISNDRGAGIGSGEGDYYGENDEFWGGDFRGEVIIGGNAEVYAEGNDDSAGIGSGEHGTFSGGSITIKDNAKVEAIGMDEGPGIGAADDTPLDGDIIIKDNAQVKASSISETTPDIGAEGGIGGDKGSISILGKAIVTATEIPLFDEDGYPVYDENEDYVYVQDEKLIIGGEYPEGFIDEEGYEWFTFGGKIRIESNTTIGGIKGSDLLENPEEYGDFISLYAEEGNITLGNEERDYLCGLLGLLLENGKPAEGTVGIKDISAEEENPETGAPVIFASAPQIVFVQPMIFVKKRRK